MPHYHDPITFGRGGNGRDLTTSGISFEEDVPYSWTLKSYADLEIRLPMARGNVALTLVATPFMPSGEVPFQQVFFYWNGLFHYFHTFLGHDTVTFVVDRVNISTRINRLALAIPTARSPQSLGLGEDLRMLGLSLTSLTLEST